MKGYKNKFNQTVSEAESFVKENKKNPEVKLGYTSFIKI
jgi:hypothetical protein